MDPGSGGLKAVAAAFPDSPGVYLFKNASGRVLYVGKALSLRKRTSSYFGKGGKENPKVTSLLSQAGSLECIHTADEDQALLLEGSLIKRHRPRYNVTLRDDKSYPYLKLTLNEEFPRVLISRKPAPDGARYYGPYPNLKLRELVKLIYRYFNIRDCDIPIDGKLDRPCLSYQIHQCPAPCTGLIGREAYGELVRRLQWFLEGRHEELARFLQGEMLKASERQDYEEAAKCRDLLDNLRRMEARPVVASARRTDLDVLALAEGLGKTLVSLLQVRQGRIEEHLGFVLENELELPLAEVLPRFLEQYYAQGVLIPGEVQVAGSIPLAPGLEGILAARKGSAVRIGAAEGGWRGDLNALAERNVLASLKEEVRRTELLQELKGLLGLRAVPRGIACFDISNLQGSYTVGSAVFFRDGAPDKSRYRKFRIREVEGPDDFASHEEMMRRYLGLLDREGLPPPELFLIDGGRGQLSAVEGVLQKAFPDGFGLAALAKREEEVFLPGRKEPVDFRGKAQALHLLQRVRDESHRFAVGYHRFLRDRGTISSLLTRVKGIGPHRLRLLLKRFNSVQEIEAAPLEELASVPGFPKELAHHLFRTLHPST